MSQVDFYFDFSCPWSYLALVRLQDVAERNGARISLRPVLLEKVLATENPELLKQRLAANPAKAAWQRSDLDAWAEFWGLRIVLDAEWPQDRSLAAAAALPLLAHDNAIPFCIALFRAAFGEGRDINTVDTLAAVAAASGADAQAAVAGLDSAAGQTELERNSLELIQRGGFGTPSMFVEDELFFGNDRIPLVEWTLGPIRDPEFVMPGQHSVW